MNSGKIGWYLKTAGRRITNKTAKWSW